MREWEKILERDPEGWKSTTTSSQYWRLSQAAFKSGKMEEFWDLSQFDKAWIVAVVEERELLQAAVEYANRSKE